MCDRDAAGLGEARSLATIGLIDAHAEDCLPAVRRKFPDIPASAWEGKLVVRALSSNPHSLRRRVAAVLEHLRGAPLPRVWQY